MKRSELYDKVWTVPLRKLAPELGLSDVGLAKLCKRMNIPVPGVGYWAKRAAGRPAAQMPLPALSTDVEVQLPGAHDVSHQLARGKGAPSLRKKARDGQQIIPLPQVAIRPTLAGCLPLVAKTSRTFAAIAADLERDRKAKERVRKAGERPQLYFPAQHRTSYGRYLSGDQGDLRIAATLTHIDWILRFHDALLRGLQECGCKVAATTAYRLGVVEIYRDGEALNLSFAEDFDKVAQPSANRRYVAHEVVQWQYRPRDTFRVKLERGAGVAKQWQGPAATLEADLPEIARHTAALLHAYHAQRPHREAARRTQQELQEQERARERELRARAERLRLQAASTAEQLKRAAATGRALDEYAASQRLLAAIEQRLASRADQGAVLGIWLTTVRSGLVDPVEALASDLERECASDVKPYWWPSDRP